MKSAIYNLYIRKMNMEQSLEQLNIEIDRNNNIIDILNRATDEEKEKLELKKFTDTISQQVDSYVEQKSKLEKMIELNSKVISMYESDKEKYKEIINSLLVSFGFEEADEEEKSDKE